jgi:hypothetical protein
MLMLPYMHFLNRTMSQRKRYKKRADTTVTAVRLDLDTEGFTYRKWGGLQTCKPGDWLVNNQGEAYTVDGESFAKTYRQISPGVFEKHAIVWVEVAEASGIIGTKEGETRYEKGDYLVYNDKQGTDGYAVTREKFDSMYQPDE